MIVRDIYDVAIIGVALVSVTIFTCLSGGYNEPKAKKSNAIHSDIGDQSSSQSGIDGQWDSRGIDSGIVKTSIVIDK